MSKRSSVLRLLTMIVLSILLFAGLALGEQYGKGWLAKWKTRGQENAGANSSPIAKAVSTYNQVLIQAYDQTSPRLLENVATEKQIKQVRLYMAWNHFEKNRKLAAKLNSLVFEKIETKKQKAIALSTENWDYFYLDEKTAKVVDKTTQTYRVRYELIKVAGDWMVDGLKAGKI